jgi:hypothetical protein
MTPAGAMPGDIVDDRQGAGCASGRMVVEDRVSDDGAAVVVHVEETISPALAGHEGVVYESPPLPRAEALALVRLLIGRDCQTADRDMALPDRGRAADDQAPARGARRDGRERTRIGDREPTVNGCV